MNRVNDQARVELYSKAWDSTHVMTNQTYSIVTSEYWRGIFNLIEERVTSQISDELIEDE